MAQDAAGARVRGDREANQSALEKQYWKVMQFNSLGAW